MARIARVVVPDLPHHVTQRGNRRQQTFFSDDDYGEYLRLMAASCARCTTAVWAYCLMPNHVHLVMAPHHSDGLRCAIGEAHRRYTRKINFRQGWRGHLWQERFHSFVMDERYLVAAVRYIETNPVRAGLCTRAADWPWSSARAHLRGEDDTLVEVAPMLSLVSDWTDYLHEPSDETLSTDLHRHMCTGRPLGDETFIDRLEQQLKRPLRPQKRGPKPRHEGREIAGLLSSRSDDNN
jgi:putative transposase